MRAKILSAALGAWAALVPTAAAAAPAASTVVLLRTGGAEELLRKAETMLGAELAAAGFGVSEVERRAGPDVRAAVEAAGGVEPIAAIALVPASRDAAEVWISDRVTGKLVVRQLRHDSGGVDAAASDLALRAVELLRGSLLEIRFEKPRPPEASGSKAPPADVAKFVGDVGPAEARRFALEGFGLAVGATVLRGFGELAAAWAPLGRLSYGTGRGLVVRVGFAGPSAAHEVLANEGTARMRQMVGTAEALWLWRPGARLQPFAKAGLCLHHLRVEGKGVSSLFEGRTTSALAPCALAGGGLVVRLWRGISAALEADLYAASRARSITIAGAEIARFGQPFAAASLGLASAF